MRRLSYTQPYTQPYAPPKRPSGTKSRRLFYSLGHIKPQPGLLVRRYFALADGRRKVEMSVSFPAPCTESKSGKSICPDLARPPPFSHACPQTIEIREPRTKRQILTKNKKSAARKISKFVRNDSRSVRFFPKKRRKSRKNRKGKDKNTSATDKKKDQQPKDRGCQVNLSGGKVILSLFCLRRAVIIVSLIPSETHREAENNGRTESAPLRNKIRGMSQTFTERSGQKYLVRRTEKKAPRHATRGRIAPTNDRRK